MTKLSKSKLLSFLNCPKSLWLDVNRRELKHDSAASEAKLKVGHTIGEISQRIYDPKQVGTVFDPKTVGYAETCARTAATLSRRKPVFEAGFATEDAWSFADVMLPIKKGGKAAWRMVEVKSSGKVKDYHRNDAAIQAYLARQTGVPLMSIAVAHVDTQWVYPGRENYAGLLREVDLTEEAFGRTEDVEGWIDDAKKLLKRRKPPGISTGRHCTDPWECGFHDFCASQEPQAEYPVAWLPKVQTKALREFLARPDTTDLRQVPDDLLNDTQLRVKKHTVANTVFFDRKGAKTALSRYSLPLYFLDFETIAFAIPIWKGTRPYQQIPFQFSLHRMAQDGSLTHKSFLDLSGNDPSKSLADALIANCGKKGAIFAYNAGFEAARINDLAKQFPSMRAGLLAIVERIVDLHPIAVNHYYHPSQSGSWSIKRVLPAIAPKLDYGALEGVQDGAMAMEAYLEAIAPETSKARKAEIERQLLRYCKLDTAALVEIWRRFK